MNYDMKTLARDFWYGKPHQERRLGDLYIDKTGLYKHREWRGFKDTMYYFYNIWMYNYAHMVMDVVRYGGLINFAKGVWRYRWVGQTYLPVLHWFDRGMEGMRGEALKASAWHYRGMVNATIFQFQRMFSSDANLHGGKRNYRWHHNVAHNETVWGGVFYPWHGKLTNVPMEMIPYFVTCHVNCHTVLNYIDAAQSIGLPGDPCPRRPACSSSTTCPTMRRSLSPPMRPVTRPSPLPSCRTGSSTSRCSPCRSRCSLTIRWSRSIAATRSSSAGSSSKSRPVSRSTGMHWSSASSPRTS